MNPFITNSPCVICTQKHYSSSLDAARQLKHVVDSMSYEPDNELCKYHFEWWIHSHCRYGLHCNILSQYDSQANRTAEELEPYLVSIAKTGSDADFYTILRCLAGHFPNVYHIMELMRHDSKLEERD